MNTSTDITPKSVAPFAAIIEFKPTNLWQGKNQRWTFRSDDISEFQAPHHKQFANLERFVLKELKGTYFQASIFDNRLPTFGKGNLILQVYNNNLKIDKRMNLDWMEPTFDKHFLEYLGDTFANDKWLIDFHATELQQAIKQYKEIIYGTNS